jgi:hypothetical protein
MRVIPKGLHISDLNIILDYGEAETVTAQYFCEDHPVGQISFTADGIRAENGSPESPADEPLSGKKERKGSFFNWKYIVFAIMAGAFVVGVFFKVSDQGYRSRNNEKRPRRRLRRNAARTKWR